MSVTNTFASVCDTWSSYCFTWGDCIAGALEATQGGARNPQEWGDHPFDNYEDQQKALLDYQIKNPVKRARLVDILLQCQNKKYKKTIEIPDKKIFIKVNDVNFIIDTLNEVGVDIKNIRKYNDDELQNLLG